MLWLVDSSKPSPLFEQVAASVRAAIANGDVVEGEKLPSAREVGDMLDINLHTVLKAFQILRDEGLIELRRGRGAVVLASRPGDARLAALAHELLAEAARLGIDPPTLGRRIAEGEWS